MGNEELQRAIANVQRAADGDTIGSGPQHVRLLDAIRELGQAAETPEEKLMRMRFEVSSRLFPVQCLHQLSNLC